MPTHKQATVDLLDENRVITKGRNDESLSISFPDSPIIGKKISLTDEERRDAYQDLALDGAVLDGWCFDNFNRDYDKNSPPDIVDVETGPGGMPGTPHMPNPLSPGVSGAGDLGVSVQSNGVDPTKLSSPPSNLEELSHNMSKPPYVGDGSDLDPMASSKRISKTKLGDYLMGKSSDLSVGSDSRGLITPSE
jgi:hypothetical protein